jgi:cell division protein ZapE
MSVLRQVIEGRARDLGYLLDPAQHETIKRLTDLASELESSQDKPSLFSRIFSNRKVLKGMYLWGGVGRGKTFLMDLFYENIKYQHKRRVHFHRLMQEVHHLLRDLQGQENPLKIVGRDIASRATLICLDEFHVSDIGDAMIMRNLLESLFDEGVVIVTTANWAPDRLYEHGLQRVQFMPTIDLIKSKMNVVNLDAGEDYRLVSLEKAGVFFEGVDAETKRMVTQLFDSLAQEKQTGLSIELQRRSVAVRMRSLETVWFDFQAICDGPRGKDDYIELSKQFHTVFISRIPKFNKDNDNARRRFTWLVDEFYDRRVNLVLDSAFPLGHLFQEALGGTEKDRTESRIIEMQTKRYLGEAHMP